MVSPVATMTKSSTFVPRAQLDALANKKVTPYTKLALK
jgi:hypothetical protein